MVSRYTRSEMAFFWSDTNGYQSWVEVEILSTETLAEPGEIP